MNSYAMKQHNRCMWSLVALLALTLIGGQAVGQCELEKFLASDGTTGDGFGQSVSISGSPGSEVAIVGAWLDDDTGSNSGSAYIYRFNGVIWVEEQKLLASDGATSDIFGQSVAINGTPGTEVAIVGAKQDDDNDTDSGSAYIYRFDGVIWVEEQKLLASDGAVDDNFGHSVSICGTPGGDVAIVGANLDDDNGMNSGSAYVYGGLSDCNGNDILDCQDIIAGTSADMNGNARPDECESFVFNLTQGIFLDTILDAITSAFDGDQFLASPSRFTSETAIDFDTKELSLTSITDINQPAGGLLILADEATLAAAPGENMTIGGTLVVNFGDRVDLIANQVVVNGIMGTELGTVTDITAPGGLLNNGTLFHQGGSLGVSDGIVNSIGADIIAYGAIQAFIINDGTATYLADMTAIGDYRNNGTTTIRTGTLTIIGTLTDNGIITGDLAGGAEMRSAAASSGLAIIGDYIAGPGASLRLPGTGASINVGGSFDVAIDANPRFDLAEATLQLNSPGGVQNLEVMSLDIGLDSSGYNRTLAGHYPLGTLRIGPGPTTVAMIDNHDNDGLGQASCEAIYVTSLIVEAGATLNSNGCPVYFQTLQLDGAVDNPANLVLLADVPACASDADGDGNVGITDFLGILANWGPCGGGPCAAFDSDDDGIVGINDFLAVLANWGLCP